MSNNNGLFRKSLSWGILVLFIGISVIPSISGYTEKTNDQLNKEVDTIFPLNNGYVNAYWKFDEGAGNTAHDSVHDYDGTIYGATWTTGYSGYALDFDGVNDYVSFDDYAKHYLGFNRTDDLIFSFYFKSSSTDKGIIYSICRGDAYGYNPGAHIALNANGTIEVQVWRLNCGVLMCSAGSYNDGSWHYAEIFYDGDTAHPLVDIYINGTLDISNGKYVCDFHSDNFKYAQMGRNSHELTDYFDGKIDEFKIIKYPGGNEQNPPIIDGPTHGDAGIEYEYTFTMNDPEGDEVYLQIDWGDGDITDWEGPYGPDEVVTKSHTWTKDGLYDIKAKTMDRWDDSRWSQAYPVRIGNWPHFAPTINGPKSGKTYQVLTYTFVAEDFEEEDVSYYVEWGDGQVEDWSDPFPSGQEVTFSHMYTTEDVYGIRAKAQDTNGAVGDWSEYYLIRIGNDAPTVPDINGPREVNKGVEYTYTFVSTDPNGDDIQYEIDWGDDNEEVTNYTPSGKEATASHKWTEKGTYTIKARACDAFGGCSAWKEITITVPRNIAFNFNLLGLLLKLLSKNAS